MSAPEWKVRFGVGVFFALVLVLVFGAAACSYNPHFQSGVTRCATSGQACPTGYSCESGLGVCVADDGGAGGGAAGQSGSGGDTSGGAGSGGNAMDAPVDSGSGGSGGSGVAGSTGSGGNGAAGSDGGGGGSGVAGNSGGGGNTDAGADAGCTADIASSPTNCGACGHSCGGGMCDHGVCQPYVLPVLSLPATSISVDTTTLYFTSAKRVLSCPKAGCVLQPTQLDDMGSGGYDTWSVVVTNGSLFFMSAPTQAGTEHDDLFMCPLNGCPSPAPPIATARFGVQYLTNAGNDVYWSDADARKTYRASCLPNAGACTAPVTIIPEGVDLRALAASSTEFYFVDTLGLQKCPVAGCPGTVATATGATPLSALIPTAVEYLGGLIYMQFGDDMHTLNGAIKTCTPASCDATTIKNFIINHDVISGLHVDANGVYWMEQSTLYSCPLTGCVGGPKTLATGVTRTFNYALSTHLIVTDDAFVYWINDDAGVIKRVAK